MKRMLFICLAAIAGTFAQAALLSPEASLRRALGSAPERIAGKGERGQFALSATYSHEGTAGVYVYTCEGNGSFLVTAADDTAPALLGYGTSPTTDATGHCAPGFEYWMDELARQVAFGASHPATGIPLKSRPERTPIQPLCSTLWNQSSPYNDMCPSKDGETAVTGCVATAMAQVMKYHNWPERGEGSIDYTCSPYGRLRLQLENEVFDWDNMLDSYTGSETQEEKDAVARLMKCAGYSVNMQYSPSASGAASILIATALGEYFKYDKSLSYLMRDYYNLYDWEDLIYASLANDGPVIYDGQSGIGGHSFVCDGYDADGYFHFNWGWGGMSDGYFLLDALDPLHQGIGGADGGFDYYQDVILGIRPDTEGNSAWNASMIIDSSVECSYDSEEDSIVFDGSVYNIGPGPLENWSLGVRYTPIDGGEPIEDLYLMEDTLPLAYGFSQFGLPMPELAAGEYLVELIYALNETGEDVRTALAPVYDSPGSIVTIGNGEPTFEMIEPGFPEFVDAVYPEEINNLKPINIKGRLENTTDKPMLAILTVILLDKDMENLLAYSTPFACDLDEMESREMDLTTTLSNRVGLMYNGLKCCIALAELNVRSGMVALLSEPAETVINKNIGVEAIEAEDTQGAAEWYGLDGVNASPTDTRLTPGIYVLKRGSQTKKVIVR